MSASSNFGNMFSVVGASAFLPFLPMLPIQVLTNNLQLLYQGRDPAINGRYDQLPYRLALLKLHRSRK
jgi:hypothetical protein